MTFPQRTCLMVPCQLHASHCNILFCITLGTAIQFYRIMFEPTWTGLVKLHLPLYSLILPMVLLLSSPGPLLTFSECWMTDMTLVMIIHQILEPSMLMKMMAMVSQRTRKILNMFLQISLVAKDTLGCQGLKPMDAVMQISMMLKGHPAGTTFAVLEQKREEEAQVHSQQISQEKVQGWLQEGE